MKKHRIFVLCFPHFGTLDNWLPIVNGINDLTNSLDFTLIIPNVTIAKSFHMDNAIVKISDRIFDTVLIHAYDDVWIKKKTVINTVNWYQNNRTILRLFDVLKRALNVKLFSNILRLPFILLRNILYKKECKLKIEDISESVSTIDILFYDIHTENNNFVLDILRLFKNNNKYSLPHALSMLDSEEQTPVPFNIENIDNIIESVAVEHNLSNDTEVILFLKLDLSHKLNEEFIKLIKLEIKSNLSPKHVPSKIFQVLEIPKTKSGKIVELAIKKIINGLEIENKNVLVNPDCLKEYQNIYHYLNKG